MPRYKVTYCEYAEHVAVIEADDPAEAEVLAVAGWDIPEAEWFIKPYELSDFVEPVRVHVQAIEEVEA